MNKNNFLFAAFFICIFSISNAIAQDCDYWYASVGGRKNTDAKVERKDEKNSQNIIEATECLLKLEEDKSRGAFGGATNTRVSQLLPHSTVEICALYYISNLFYEKYNHADGVALRYKNYEENSSLNSDEAVKAAYESYRKWFEKVKEIGLEEARKQKLDPLEGSNWRWY